MAASTASLLCAWDCGRARPVSELGDRSARARFLLPLLWAVKMEGLVFEGRARPVVVGVAVGVEARREERVDVKAALVELLVEVGLVVRGRGRP